MSVKKFVKNHRVKKDNLSKSEYPKDSKGVECGEAFATAVGLLTWFKTIHHQLAAREMSQGQDYKSQGDIPAGVRKFERAIGRAPDVPTYYSFLANVYLAYAGKIHNDLVPREAECDLQSQGNDAAYIECLDRKAFDIKPRAVGILGICLGLLGPPAAFHGDHLHIDARNN